MNGTAHFTGGLLTGLGLYYFWIPDIAVIIVAIIGASIPDIDRRLPLFTHRGIMHTLVGASFFVLFFKWMGLIQGFELALFAGYLSHMLLDTTTKMGIMWFYPISKVRI